MIFAALEPAALNATVILSPGIALANTLGEKNNRPLSAALDQSGLSAPYVSGTTDFLTYTATTTNATGNGNIFRSDNPTGFIDLDLGGLFNITGLALWNVNGSRAVRDFEIFVSADATFSTVTSLAAFTDVTQGNGGVLEAQALTFSSGALTRYVRLQITDNYGHNNQVSFGELGFQATPEPSTLVLTACALGLFVFWNRRKAISAPALQRAAVDSSAPYSKNRRTSSIELL